MSGKSESSDKRKGEECAFYKGGEKKDSVKRKDVQKEISGAMNGRHIAFLFGSGCSSSLDKGGIEVGVPTMQPLAEEYSRTLGNNGKQGVQDCLKILGVKHEDYESNLESLLGILYAWKFGLSNGVPQSLQESDIVSLVDSTIRNIKSFIFKKCNPPAENTKTIIEVYKKFYRRLFYRDRTLPRPWIFTTNYDLFNERAMDELNIPYCNGFSGGLIRRFNPSVFRYTLAQQLDITDKKWAAVDSYVYLCKLHGSINWHDDGAGLWPYIEKSPSREYSHDSTPMIFPTPAKQGATFGSPYSDLFRELQGRVVREQSVLFVVGYGFADEHINNIIFQALTIPSFRLIAFVPNDSQETVRKLRELEDPRIWLIRNQEEAEDGNAHFFKSFVDDFLPTPPNERADEAIEKLAKAMGRAKDRGENNGI